MENLFHGIIFLGNLIAVTQNNVFGINFAIISGWGVEMLDKTPLFRRVPPCVAETCALRPVFARVVGELRAADASKCLRGYDAGASCGAQSEAFSQKPGHQQHQGSEKPGQSAQAESTPGVFP